MFSATIEAALLHFTGECEMGPIEYALKKHKEWYKGDGCGMEMVLISILIIITDM